MTTSRNLEHLSGSIEAERSRAMGLHVAAMMSICIETVLTGVYVRKHESQSGHHTYGGKLHVAPVPAVLMETPEDGQHRGHQPENR